MEIRFVDITPEMAAKMLAMNFDGNRNIRKNVVAKYANDMANGRWNENVGGIIRFSSSGKLIDGQHRLHAVVKSGAPVRFLVQTGLDESDYQAIDSGTPRTVGDSINLPNARACAAIGRFVTAFDNGDSAAFAIRSSSPSKAEIVEKINKMGDRISAIAQASKRLRSSIGRGSETAYGCFIFLASFVDEDAVDMFVDDFCDKDPEFQPVRMAKSRLMRMFATTKGKPDPVSIAGTMLQAFNSFVEGREVGSLNKPEVWVNRYDEIARKAMDGNHDA